MGAERGGEAPDLDRCRAEISRLPGVVEVEVSEGERPQVEVWFEAEVGAMEGSREEIYLPPEIAGVEVVARLSRRGMERRGGGARESS